MKFYVHLFIAFLSTNIQKISTFEVLCPAIFSKFPKLSKQVSENFQLVQNLITINFVPKFIENPYIDQISVKFAHKTPKTANLSLKTFLFYNF